MCFFIEHSKGGDHFVANTQAKDIDIPVVNEYVQVSCNTEDVIQIMFLFVGRVQVNITTITVSWYFFEKCIF